MKILIDMNLSPDWVLVFAKYSIDSVHWSNVGDPTAIDQIIMAWAVTNGYIVFTHDLDFGILLATTQANAPSVIQVRTQDILPATLENIVIPVLRAPLSQKPGFCDNFCISTEIFRQKPGFSIRAIAPFSIISAALK